ncbi:MAG: hypothetical protein ABSH20_22575 [Tepidisphaeraceae bacterium]|jgi:hypothetical protein
MMIRLVPVWPILCCLISTGCVQSEADRPPARPPSISATAASATRPVGELDPAARFFTIRDRARKITYVVNMSVNLERFDDVRCELGRTIAALDPAQSFNIVLVGGAKQQWLTRRFLLPANSRNKELALKHIESYYVSGMYDCCDLFRDIFAQEPQVVYFLADGFIGAKDQVRLCTELAKARRIRVNTLGYVSGNLKPEAGDLDFLDSLKMLARESGGTFRQLTDSDLSPQ